MSITLAFNLRTECMILFYFYIFGLVDFANSLNVTTYFVDNVRVK